MPNTKPVGVAFSDPALTAGTTITDATSITATTLTATTATLTSATVPTLVTTTSSTIGNASGSVGFYGKTPVVIRPYSSAVHATSAASVSSSFGATQLAILQELMNTNVGLGLYATV